MYNVVQLKLIMLQSELQVRGVLRIIQRQFFLFLNENICCDPSLEPSQRDGSKDGSQNMFLWRNVANYP